MTIDELSQLTRVTTRNIRAYQSKGLLPSPEIVGRTGYYGKGHLDRLQLIVRLMDRGFSTTSIRALLSDWEQGSSLSDALGMGDVLGAGQSATISRKELQRLFPEVTSRPDLFAQSVALGLFQLDADSDIILVPEPLFLDVGVKLARAGVPIEQIVLLFERLVEELRPAAQRYADVLLKHVLSPSRKANGASRARAFSELVPLGRVAVSSTFARVLRVCLAEVGTKSPPKRGRSDVRPTSRSARTHGKG